MTQNQKLEDLLLSINSLTHISKKAGKAKTPQEQADIYRMAAQMISKGDETKYDNIIERFSINPAYAVIEMDNIRDDQARSIKEQYEKEGTKIIKDVESRINENLKGAKNKAQASMILAQYLNDILDIQEYTQEQADELKKQEIRDIGFHYTFGARGNIEQYKALETREKASKYLIGNDEEGYSVNYDKLNEAMKDIVKGASLYSKALMIEEVNKQRAEAIKKAQAKK